MRIGPFEIRRANTAKGVREDFDILHHRLERAALRIPHGEGSWLPQDIASEIASIQMALGLLDAEVEGLRAKRDTPELQALLGEIVEDRDFIREEVLG